MLAHAPRSPCCWSAPAALVAVPAAAPASAPDSPSAAARAQARPVHAVIIFDKNPRNPSTAGSSGRPTAARSRSSAPSGGPGPGSAARTPRTRAPAAAAGCPTGGTTSSSTTTTGASSSRDAAFFLGNKTCHDGTPRTELFIHTETGDRNRQCRNARGDQRCRWEWPKVNDYRSGGCIKMSPKDLRQLTRQLPPLLQRRHPLPRPGPRQGHELAPKSR